MINWWRLLGRGRTLELWKRELNNMLSGARAEPLLFTTKTDRHFRSDSE